MVHCNNKKIIGFRWKRSQFMATYCCSNSNCQNKPITFELRDILVACREIGSPPEQVKQKANLSDHNIQLKNLTMFKKEHLVPFFVRY